MIERDEQPDPEVDLIEDGMPEDWDDRSAQERFWRAVPDLAVHKAYLQARREEFAQVNPPSYESPVSQVARKADVWWASLPDSVRVTVFLTNQLPGDVEGVTTETAEGQDK